MKVLEMKLFLGMKSVGCILRCLWDVVGDVFGDDKKRLAMTVGDEKNVLGMTVGDVKKLLGLNTPRNIIPHSACSQDD